MPDVFRRYHGLLLWRGFANTRCVAFSLSVAGVDEWEKLFIGCDASTVGRGRAGNDLLFRTCYITCRVLGSTVTGNKLTRKLLIC